MSILNAEQRRQFQDEGYLVLDPGIPERLLDEAVTDLDPLYERTINDVGHVEPCRIQDGWKISAACHHIAVWPAIMEALRELYGRGPRPFQTLNFPVGTIQKAHSDAVHFNSCPPGFMSGVWVALEDTDGLNGAVDYYPGSHLLPDFDMSDAGAEPKEEQYARYEEFIANAIEHFGLERRTASLEKGQALVWASGLIHAGGDREDPFRTRHSQVTHVYYEGCRYYTPMMSKGLDVLWREPGFLPLEVDESAKPKRRKKATNLIFRR